MAELAAQAKKTPFRSGYPCIIDEGPGSKGRNPAGFAVLQIRMDVNLFVGTRVIFFANGNRSI
jgi:hypothetical protein